MNPNDFQIALKVKLVEFSGKICKKIPLICINNVTVFPYLSIHFTKLILKEPRHDRATTTRRKSGLYKHVYINTSVFSARKNVGGCQNVILYLYHLEELR